LRPPLPDWPATEFRFVREACKTSVQDNTPIRTQILIDLQSSSWQQKLYSSFCVIKYLILAILGVEAIVAFLIMLHLRIAWAVTLNRFGVGCARSRNRRFQIRCGKACGKREGRDWDGPASPNQSRTDPGGWLRGMIRLMLRAHRPHLGWQPKHLYTWPVVVGNRTAVASMVRTSRSVRTLQEQMIMKSTPARRQYTRLKGEPQS
jgi:hypothetical protein